MEISIRIKNIEGIREYLKERPAKMKEEFNRAIKRSVLAVERQAKINSPVDTGRMKTSIQAREYEMKGEVGVGVRYAIFVEMGTRFMRARPFLANAVRSLILAIQKYFQEAIKAVLEK